MMKPFNSLHELDEEKKKLAQRRAELEKNIGNDLKNVKESLNPAKMFTREKMRTRLTGLAMKLFGKLFRNS